VRVRVRAAHLDKVVLQAARALAQLLRRPAQLLELGLEDARRQDVCGERAGRLVWVRVRGVRVRVGARVRARVRVRVRVRVSVRLG